MTQLESAQAVALVRRVDKSKFRIEKLLKGPEQILGKVVIAGGPESPKEPYLLLTTAGSANAPYWSDLAVPLKEDGIRFVKAALPLVKAPDAKKWDLATGYLESPSEEVANACYNLLAAAPLDEVTQRGKRVGQARLLGWVKNGKISEQRRALYLLMALPGLTKSDLPWLKGSLFAPVRSSFSSLLGPLILGYLQVVGPEGIESVKGAYLKPEYTATTASEVVNAFITLGQSSDSPKLREAARAVIRAELANPKRSILAIPPLALWQDYSVAPQIEKLAGKQAPKWTRVAAVRYFRTFSTVEAKQTLARLRAADQALYEMARDAYRPDELIR